MTRPEPEDPLGAASPLSMLTAHNDTMAINIDVRVRMLSSRDFVIEPQTSRIRSADLRRSQGIWREELSLF